MIIEKFTYCVGCGKKLDDLSGITYDTFKIITKREFFNKTIIAVEGARSYISISCGHCKGVFCLLIPHEILT